MQSSYSEQFERDMGTSAAEWLAALPRAIGPQHAWQQVGSAAAEVVLPVGRLHLQWKPLPERRIALLVMPRLWVGFRFEGTTPEQRLAFMRPFDLAMQRGGG